MIEIGVGVFIGAVEGEDELPVELPPGQEIEAQHHRRGYIVDMHRALPEPAHPVAVSGVHRAVPMRNKPARAQRDDVHMAVLAVILGDPFGENLAAAVPCPTCKRWWWR